MRPIRKTISLVAADNDGICASQTPGAAGNLNINGALASGGAVTFDSGNAARQVLVTCAGNETGKTITVYGTILAGGDIVSEALAGPNVSTVTTTAHFLTVTRVSISAAAAGAIIVGTNAVGSTPWIPLDHYQKPFNVGFAIEVPTSSPPTYTFQYTFDNVQDQTLTPASSKVYADSTYTSKSTSLNGNIIAPCTAVRLQLETASAAAELNVIQAGGGQA